LVSAQSLSNLKIDQKISLQVKSMVKNQFLDCEFIPFKNKGYSSSSLRAGSKVMTPKKFSKHGFSFFIEFNDFSSDLDQGAILGVRSSKLFT
jgi:hypothetical protein